MSGHWWWLRRIACLTRGHVPDGVVRGGNDEGGGGEMWCARRCGLALRPGDAWMTTTAAAPVSGVAARAKGDGDDE